MESAVPSRLNIGDRLEMEIVDMAFGGEGVGKLDGFVIFVPFVITGEVALVEITECKKDFARGKLLQILNPSPDRVDPKCQYFGECGGCQYQHLNYSEQLRWKKSKSKNYCYTWLTSHLKWTKSLHLLINILTGQN
mgnify:CR=1 FL=1